MIRICFLAAPPVIDASRASGGGAGGGAAVDGGLRIGPGLFFTAKSAKSAEGALAPLCTPAGESGKPPRGSVTGCQAEDVADFVPDGVAPFQADQSALAKQFRLRDAVHQGAIAEGLPVHAISPVQQDFKRVGLPVLALAGAIEHVHDRRPGAEARMRYQDYRVLPFRPAPYTDLVLCSASRNPLPKTQVRFVVPRGLPDNRHRVAVL
jgi:hypothetical protein